MLDQINKRTHADRFTGTTQIIITKEKKLPKDADATYQNAILHGGCCFNQIYRFHYGDGWNSFEIYVVAKNARSSIKFNAQPTSMYRMQKSFRVPYFHAILLMETVCTVYT